MQGISIQYAAVFKCMMYASVACSCTQSACMQWPHHGHSTQRLWLQSTEQGSPGNEQTERRMHAGDATTPIDPTVEMHANQPKSPECLLHCAAPLTTAISKDDDSDLRIWLARMTCTAHSETFSVYVYTTLPRSEAGQRRSMRIKRTSRPCLQYLGFARHTTFK
jgi:hypothetical protein